MDFFAVTILSLYTKIWALILETFNMDTSKSLTFVFIYAVVDKFSEINVIARKDSVTGV